MQQLVKAELDQSKQTINVEMSLYWPQEKVCMGLAIQSVIVLKLHPNISPSDSQSLSRAMIQTLMSLRRCLAGKTSGRQIHYLSSVAECPLSLLQKSYCISDQTWHLWNGRATNLHMLGRKMETNPSYSPRESAMVLALPTIIKPFMSRKTTKWLEMCRCKLKESELLMCMRWIVLALV